MSKVEISKVILAQKPSYLKKWVADRKKKHPEIDWDKEVGNDKGVKPKGKTD